MLIDFGQFDSYAWTNSFRNSLQLPSLFLGCKNDHYWKSYRFPKYLNETKI